METGEYGKVPGTGKQTGQFRRLAPAVVRQAMRPRALPLALLLLTIAGGAWAQDAGSRVAWETFASNGVVLAFVLLALRFLHKGLTELRAELGSVQETLSAHGERLGRLESGQEAFAADLSGLRTETGSLRAELGSVQETLSAHGERLGRIEAAQEAFAADLSDLRTTMHGVRDTVHTSAERLAWVEGAIDRRLKPAANSAAARSADPVPAG